MEAYMTMITPYGLTFTIRDWAKCQGQLLSIAQFSALFSLMGTQYGGDGINSFGLPNLQSRSPVSAGHGAGLNPMPQGATGGQETRTLTVLDMPAHEHAVATSGQLGAATGDLKVSTDAANSASPDGNFLGAGSAPVRLYTAAMSDPAGAQAGVAELPPRGVQIAGSTQMAGGNLSLRIRNPYQGVNYQICIQGIFPSRS